MLGKKKKYPHTIFQTVKPFQILLSEEPVWETSSQTILHKFEGCKKLGITTKILILSLSILLCRLITKQVNPCLTFENHCICQQPSLIDACTLWWFLAIQKHNVSFSWPHNMSSFSVTSLSFCWFPFTQRVLNKTHVYHEVPESMRLESFSIRLA